MLLGIRRNLCCLVSKSRSMGLGTVGAPVPSFARARFTGFTMHLLSMLRIGRLATVARSRLRTMQPAREQD